MGSFAEITPEQAIDFWAQKTGLPRDVFYALSAEDRARAFTASYLWNQHAIGAAAESLGKAALEEGGTVRQWRTDSWKDIAAKYGNGRADEAWYVDTVFRTNVQAAYASGQYAEMFDPEQVARAPYVQYSAIRDARTRPEHAALHGKVFRKDDRNARRYFPPLGFNCRCTLIEMDEEDLLAGGWKVTPGSAIPGLQTRDGKPIGMPPDGWNTDRVEALRSPALGQVTQQMPVEGPSGTPVSSKLAVTTRKKQFGEMLTVIDSVHGDGALSAGELVSRTSDKGYYRPTHTGWSKTARKFAQVPTTINVGKQSAHWRVQMAHEVGHWLDFEGLGPLGKGGHARVVAPEIMRAIDSSDAVKRMTATLPRGARRNYVLSDEEKFARAYSQYIAAKSGHAEMLKEVALWRSGSIGREADGMWSDDDFKPILEAFDTAFRRVGWRT